MSSLAVGRGMDVELWLGGLFSAAELAAADLLLQLSVAGGAGGDDEAAESSSATTYSSRRSASPCLELEDFAAVEMEVEVDEPVVEEKKALPLGSMELERRARKRYRFLSELYAATSPVTSTTAAAAAKKRKRRHQRHHDGSSEEATRYGGDPLETK